MAGLVVNLFASTSAVVGSLHLATATWYLHQQAVSSWQ